MFDVLVNGERRSFTKTKVSIGRAADCDLTLESDAVSRRHAELMLRSGSFMVVDLNTSSGTLVNGRKIRGSASVTSGDEIRIGDFALRVTLPGEQPTAPAAAASASGAPTVCGGCGALVAPARDTCFVCRAPYSQARPMQRHADGLLFALVSSSSVRCPHCNLDSSVSRLELGSEVDCKRCGATSAFDTQQWIEALDFAHVALESQAGVADIAAASSTSSATREHGGALAAWDGKEPGAYTLRASPGTPLCARCHAPLAVALESGALTTRCAACDVSQTYALPPSAAPLAGALVGVIGEEHRTDRPLAKSPAARSSVAMALECPKCNSSLPLQRDMRDATCGYCGTVSLIPPRFLRLADDKLDPFWLVFRGPSRARRQAEEKQVEERRAEETRAEEKRAVEAARQEAQRTPAPAERPVPVACVVPDADQSTPSPRGSGVIVATVIIIAVVGLIAYLLLR
jgi:hypothetical protein